MKKIILIYFLFMASLGFSQMKTTDDIIPLTIKEEFTKQASPFIAKTRYSEVKVVAKYISIVKDMKYTWYATEYNEATEMLMVFVDINNKSHDFGAISLTELKILSGGADKDFSIYACTLQDLFDGLRP